MASVIFNAIPSIYHFCRANPKTCAAVAVASVLSIYIFQKQITPLFHPQSSPIAPPPPPTQANPHKPEPVQNSLNPNNQLVTNKSPANHIGLPPKDTSLDKTIATSKLITPPTPTHLQEPRPSSLPLLKSSQMLFPHSFPTQLTSQDISQIEHYILKNKETLPLNQPITQRQTQLPVHLILKGDSKLNFQVTLICPKTGLTPAEAHQIDEYVKQESPNWERLALEKPIRLLKEDTKLPRTLQICRDLQQKLCVFVLLNRKNIKMIGSGFFKKVLKAYDPTNQKFWARIVAVREGGVDYPKQTETFFKTVGSSNRGLEEAPVGVLAYTNKKNRQRYNFFQPLMDGDLTHLEKLSENEYLSLVDQLLDGLTVFENHRLVHTDIKDENILFERQNGQIVGRISDIDLYSSPEETRQHGYDMECMQKVFKQLFDITKWDPNSALQLKAQQLFGKMIASEASATASLDFWRS